MLLEETIAQIVGINFVRKILSSIGIDFTALWRDIGFAGAIFVVDNVWIVVGIDVDSETQCMLGKAGGAIHHPVIEAGGVVGFHG